MISNECGGKKEKQMESKEEDECVERKRRMEMEENEKGDDMNVAEKMKSIALEGSTVVFGWPPLPRTSAAVAVGDTDKVWMVAGSGPQFGHSSYGDVWELDVRAMTWRSGSSFVWIPYRFDF